MDGAQLRMFGMQRRHLEMMTGPPARHGAVFMVNIGDVARGADGRLVRMLMRGNIPSVPMFPKIVGLRFVVSHP